MIDALPEPMRSLWVVLTVLLLAPSRQAWALSQSEHQRITEKACRAAHLTDAFCKRMAVAAYSVDGYEWDDMAAHAQRESGQPACESADRSALRLTQLASNAVIARNAGSDDVAADEFGRALHTLQDECAHHGMSNAQHAHFSLRDVCGETGASPDAAPEAKQCAIKRTNAAMVEIAKAVAGRPIHSTCSTNDSGDGNDCGRIAGPSPIEVCDFLSEHAAWTGEDTRWQPIVGERLLAAFTLGMHGIGAPSVCADGAIAVEPPAVLPHEVATSCGLIALTCLGKVDDPISLDDDSGAADAGCAAAGNFGDASSALVLLVGWVGLAACRRRHRRTGMA